MRGKLTQNRLYNFTVKQSYIKDFFQVGFLIFTNANVLHSLHTMNGLAGPHWPIRPLRTEQKALRATSHSRTLVTTLTTLVKAA